MLFYPIYGVARRLLRAFAGASSVSALEIENAVLRHQLAVLRRKAGRLHLRRLDRVLLAAASRLLQRERWSSFLVTPQTLLRGHRELVRRKWRYRRRRTLGRPPLDSRIKDLIVRLGRENSRWGLCPDPGGAPQARRLGRGHHDQDDPKARGTSRRADRLFPTYEAGSGVIAVVPM